MSGEEQEKKHRFMVRAISLWILASIFLARFSLGQDKKERSPVLSSLSFQLSGYTQFLYAYWDKGIDSFSIRRARLSLTGEVVKKIRFKLQTELVKSPVLLEAQVDFLFNPMLSLRIGQYYVPFSLENTTSDSELDTLDRSQVVEKLAPSRDRGSSGRDIGAMLFGKFSIVEYMAGVFNGSGINKADTNKQKDISARVILHPVEFLSVGGSLYNGRYSPTEGTPPVTRDRAGLEATLSLGAFSLKSEYISGKDDQTSRSGWYIQGAYFFLPKKLQAVVKWDTYDADKDISSDRSDVLTLGLSWFLSEKTKLVVNYDVDRKEGEGTTNSAVFVQFQVGF
jgi:phosphate-selective porin